MSPLTTPLAVSGAAAIFALLSVLIGLMKWRWDGIDSELEREQKIERLVIGESVTSNPYTKEDMPKDVSRAVGQALGVSTEAVDQLGDTLDEPEFEFKVVDVVVTEVPSFWRKMVYGFVGKSSITVLVGDTTLGFESKFPPDICLLRNFEPEPSIDYTIETYAEDAEIVLTVDSANEDRVEALISQLFAFIDEECGDTTLEWDS